MTLKIYHRNDVLEFYLQDSTPSIEQSEFKIPHPDELNDDESETFLIHDAMDEVKYFSAPSNHGSLFHMTKYIGKNNSDET